MVSDSPEYGCRADGDGGALGFLNSLTKPWVEGPSLYGVCRGWPFPAFLYPLDKNPESEWHIVSLFLGANIAVALAILASVAVGCEWWVRRKEGLRITPNRKPPAASSVGPGSSI